MITTGREEHQTTRRHDLRLVATRTSNDMISTTAPLSMPTAYRLRLQACSGPWHRCWSGCMLVRYAISKAGLVIAPSLGVQLYKFPASYLLNLHVVPQL